MFINDVGQSTWEEINEGVAGRQLRLADDRGPDQRSPVRDAVYAYRHTRGAPAGCAITGGAFYNPRDAAVPGRATPATTSSPTSAAAGSAGSTRRPADVRRRRSRPASRRPSTCRSASDGSLYYLARGAGRDRARSRVTYSGSQAPIDHAAAGEPHGRGRAAGDLHRLGLAAAAPLAYQWQRERRRTSPGATAPTLHARERAARRQRRALPLRRDATPRAAATSNAATLTVTTNQAPVAGDHCTPPATRATRAADDRVLGHGTDPEDGTLPAAAFTWEVDFHHDTHTHPFLGRSTGTTAGSFTDPDDRRDRRRTSGTAST